MEKTEKLPILTYYNNDEMLSQVTYLPQSFEKKYVMLATYTTSVVLSIKRIIYYSAWSSRVKFFIIFVNP